MLINLFGLLFISLIVWWFWLYKEKEMSVSEDEILITVEDGVYQPSRIKLSAGQPTTLQFLRKDASPCSATLLIPDFDISADLPMNKVSAIDLPTLKKGEYPFHCQMQMYKGTLIVE
tara:strand:- start:2337 stop:2687 length:351 start_codon:yes stop_codon:yes gene_type:complete